MRTSTLVYDGDCAVCTTLVRFVGRRVRRQPRDFTIVAWQHTDLSALGLTQEQCEEALQWVEVPGRVSSAQNAVARLLLAGRLWWRPMGAALLVPGVNTVAGFVYRWVAANRHRLPGGTATCSLPAAERPS